MGRADGGGTGDEGAATAGIEDAAEGEGKTSGDADDAGPDETNGLSSVFDGTGDSVMVTDVDDKKVSVVVETLAKLGNVAPVPRLGMSGAGKPDAGVDPPKLLGASSSSFGGPARPEGSGTSFAGADASDEGRYGSGAGAEAETLEAPVAVGCRDPNGPGV